MMNEHFLNATVQYIKTLFTSHMAKTLNPTSTRKAETDRRTYEPLHYVNSSQAVGYIHAGKVWQIYLKLFTILPAGVHSRVRVSPFSTVPPRSTPAYAKNGLLFWIIFHFCFPYAPIVTIQNYPRKVFSKISNVRYQLFAPLASG